MPLNKDLLGAEIEQAVEAFNNKNQEELGDMASARSNYFKALAGAIITHIKTNAQVSVNVTVTTAGSATNQAGGGTGTGTIS